jgi:integrase
VPAEQEGSVYKTTTGYGLRWYDEHGVRRRKAGFSSPSKARAWFREVERKRMRGETPEADRTITLEEHVDRYLAAHATGREASTIKTLGHRLGYATATFGDLTLDELERRVPEIAAWIGTLPPGSRYGIVQALRQALEAAVRWGHMTKNPAKLAGPNPQPKAEEIHPFTQAEIDLVAVELGDKYGPAVVFASETGMRPSEWLAIEWRDVDRKAGVVLVERTCAYGVTKSYGKTARSRRRVPLSARALEALDQVPRRLDVRLVFPGVRGGVVDLKHWRRAYWKPALEAAGIPSRRIYDLRHSFATWALDAGLSIFELARYMGTSVEMIDRTYGHLAQGAEASARSKLDAAYARRLGQERAKSESGEDG